MNEIRILLKSNSLSFDHSFDKQTHKHQEKQSIYLTFNFEHFLFVNIVKQKQKKFTDFKQKFRGFSKFDKIRILFEVNKLFFRGQNGPI